MLDQLYKQVVMDHYQKPRNRGRIENPDANRLPYKNPTCGDIIVLGVVINSQNTIEDIKYEGEGCSISMASCSMMTEQVKGKTINQAKNLIHLFKGMIKTGNSLEDESLGDAHYLIGVHKFTARHNCALMGWQALEKILMLHERDKR